jgi:uncharacterized protein (TIGR03437 family)
LGLLTAGLLPAQLSTSAYRVLGQPDLRQNGINKVRGIELRAPGALALDGRSGVLRLYISDTRNHRVLAWPNANAYQNGDPPALVLGQPSPQNSAPMGIGVKGFNRPLGLAVDPLTGNVYVADSGNSRVLRFPNPFANPSRVEPDAVYGQPDFTTLGANPAGAGRNSLNAPRAVAFDSQGNLWVADTGNHRVLRFNVAALDRSNPEADLVIGQKDFSVGAANRGAGAVSGSGFDTPAGLAFDSQGNVYVSDLNNARVLKFAVPSSSDPAAVAVFGQTGFVTRGVEGQPPTGRLAGPAGLAVDKAGSLFVAVPGDNRIMIFASSAPSGSQARDVLGQTDFNATAPNPFTFPLASSRGFAGVSDVKTDAGGNLYIVDTGNNRVLSFPPGSKAAAGVWGQNDFSANGINQVKPDSINGAFKIAVDYSQAPYALYVSDTGNHRVLGWKDAAKFRNGDPADLVIGQPDFTTAFPNVDTRGSSSPVQSSLASPKGISVDVYGNLYVADSGNNRVLRYPRPVNQAGRITPDLVIGQFDFNSSTSAGVSASSLRGPSGVAIGPDGDLFVADTGNNRVLEFPAGAGIAAAAIRVYGQPNFAASAPSSPPSAQTLLAPQGLFVDAGTTLYVSDSGNNRIAVFPNTRDAPSAGMPAYLVIGQSGFDVSTPSGGPGGLNNPADVVVAGNGDILAADFGNHRVVVYPSLWYIPLAGGQAYMVLGQRDLNSSVPNWNSSGGLATPDSLLEPQGVFIDRQNTAYVADAGNNRVLHFLKPAKVAYSAGRQTGTALARGGMVVISGNGFAAQEESAADTPLPLSLAGREVVINDEFKTPLAFLGPENVSLQIPSLAPLGTQRIAIRSADTGELIAGATVALAASAPALFDAGQSKHGVLNQDGSLNSATNPAVKGTVIKVFGTGQGPVSPQINDGDAAPPDTPVLTVAVPTTDGASCIASQPSVCVAIGNTFGEIEFSGLAPGLVGIWQLAVKIPPTAQSGDAVALRAVINGVPSNIITVAIK